MNFKGKLYFTLMIAMDSLIIGKAHYDFYLSYCLFDF